VSRAGGARHGLTSGQRRMLQRCSRWAGDGKRRRRARNGSAPGRRGHGMGT
jgi:hypothetical protein